MKIKVNVSVFLGILLCVALMGGVWMMKYGGNSNGSAWNPSQMYNSLGGAARASATFGSATSSSDDVSVPMTSTRITFRKTPSYAAAYEAAAAALASNRTSNATAASPISYTSSSASYQSFGGGGMMASGVNNGSFHANNNPGAPVSLAMPSVPTYASARNVSAVQSEQATQGSSAIIAAAPAYMSSGYSYNIMRGSISQIGVSASPLTMGNSGSLVYGAKKAPGVGTIFDDWLQDMIGSGLGVWNEGEGVYWFGDSALEAAYWAAVNNGQLPPGATWEQFVEWFNGQGDKYAFAPIPDGVWFMCFLALLYALFVIVKRNSVKSV